MGLQDSTKYAAKSAAKGIGKMAAMNMLTAAKASIVMVALAIRCRNIRSVTISNPWLDPSHHRKAETNAAKKNRVTLSPIATNE